MNGKRWIGIFVCAAMLCGQASALPEMGGIKAKSAALYAADGTALYGYHEDERLQPASVTKIMTSC